MWTEDNNTSDLIEGILRHGPDILAHCQTTSDIQNYLDRIDQEHLDYPIPPNTFNSSNWFIPRDYCPNLTNMLFDLCETDQQRDRVTLELELFVKNGMYDVLPVMKYIVDVLRANNVLWGVGRGSSVASYVLYLIGVHKIDSIKYNLPIEEFFKGDENG
jgi:DNA polymerase III alpha subunit